MVSPTLLDSDGGSPCSVKDGHSSYVTGNGGFRADADGYSARLNTLHDKDRLHELMINPFAFLKVCLGAEFNWAWKGACMLARA